MVENQRPVALVTGASKRIGAAISRHLHQAGFNVALHYGNSKTEAEGLAAELNSSIPGSAATFQADLRNLASITTMTAQLLDYWHRVDTVINNASTFFPTPIDSSVESDWHELIDSNLKGPYFLIKQLTDTLQKQRGSVVNIIDINARHPLKGYPIYCIAKAGKAMLTKTLAKELAPQVNVNGVAPGSILWPEGKAEMSEEEKQKTLGTIPLQRLGTPDDIAALACFLASSAGYITGQIIAVDGGLHLQGDQG